MQCDQPRITRPAANHPYPSGFKNRPFLTGALRHDKALFVFVAFAAHDA
jgi:hypothetical protein